MADRQTLATVANQSGTEGTTLCVHAKENAVKTHDENPVQFEVRPGGGIIPPLKGNLYQIQIAALLALRGLQHGYKFSITSEERGYGTLDDVTFKFEDKLFHMQAKHSVTNDKIKADEFYKPKGDFSLQEHFCSFLGCKWLAEKNKQQVTNFLIFTNKGIVPALKDSVYDVNDPKIAVEECELPDFLKNLLGGTKTADDQKFYKLSTKVMNHLSDHLSVAFSEDPKNQKNIEKGAKEFYKGLSSDEHAQLKEEYLRMLILAIDQPNQDALKPLIKETLSKVKLQIVGAEELIVPDVHVDILYDCFNRFVMDWATDYSPKRTKRGPLTNENVLKDCFGSYFQNYNMNRRSLTTSPISFCNETPVFNILKSLTHRLNVLVTTQPRTCAFLTELSLRIMGKNVAAYPCAVCHDAGMELLWGYRRHDGALLLIDDGVSHGHEALRIANQLIDINNKIQVYVISNRKYETESCVVVPEVKPAHITQESLQAILKLKINYQGKLVDMHSLVGAEAALLTALESTAVESLVTYDASHLEYFTKVGNELDPRPRSYKERDLQSSEGTFSESEVVDSVFRERHVIVSAPAGAGKSALLNSVGLIIKDLKSDFWVLKCDLEKARWVFTTDSATAPFESDKFVSCLELLKKLANFEELSPFEANMFDLATHGKMAILFDSFEAINSSYWDIFFDFVKGLLHFENVILVASRTSPEQHLRQVDFVGFQSYSLCSLRLSEQKELLARLLDVNESSYRECYEHATRILESPLKEDPLEPFYGNPQHLTMVADLFLEHKDEIHKMNRLQIYQSFMDQMFQKYWKFLGISSSKSERITHIKDTERNEVETLHQLLAIRALILPASLNEYEFVEELDTAKRVLAKEFGLVTECEEGTHIFLHRTYAEYYFSLYLKNQMANGKLTHHDISIVLKAEDFALVRYFLDRKLEGSKQALGGATSWPLKSQIEVTWPDAKTERTKLVELISSLNQDVPFSVHFLPHRNFLDTALLENLPDLSAQLWAHRHLIPESEIIDVFIAAALTQNCYMIKRTLHELAKNNFDVNLKVTSRQVTALHLACGTVWQPCANIEKVTEAVGLLVSKGADVNARSVDGESPLHFAVRSGNPSVVKLLLERRAKVDAKTNSGMTALHYAASDGKEEIIALLQSHGCNMLAKTAEAETALHLSVKSNHEGAAKLLLSFKCEIDATDSSKMTALLYAIKEKNIAVVNLLLSSGSNVLQKSHSDKLPYQETDDIKLHTILFKATIQASLNPQKYLSPPGKEIEAKPDQITHLHLAALSGDEPTCKRFLETGADVNERSLKNNTPLHFAALAGHKNITKLLLKNKGDVNVPNEGGMTPLHLASQIGHANVVKLLLDYKGDMNMLDKNDQTPLHFASLNGHAAVVQLLLNYKCEVDVRDTEKMAPLHLASLLGHANVVKLLLDFKCDINVMGKDERTPLHAASQNGHAKVVKLLIDYECDVDVRDKDGVTPLHVASFYGHEDVVKLLLANKCEVNVLQEDGMTPLHVASQNDHAEVVKVLLEYNCDMNLRQKDESTPLNVASQNGHAEAVKLLLGHNCDINVKDKDAWTPLHLASLNGHGDVVKLLLASKCDVNVQGMNGRTPLHLASQNGHAEKVKLLLDHNCDIKVKDKDGWTPLHLASLNGHGDVVKLLLASKCDVNVLGKDDGTPLHLASQNGHAETVKLLLDDNFDINVKDKNGWTPLHLASLNGHGDVVKLLLASKCDVNVITKDNMTPLHLASTSGHAEVVKLLLDDKCAKNAQNDDGGTPLHFASNFGHEAIVKLLLANEGDIDARDNGGVTPLFIASMKGHANVVKLLLHCECNIKVPDKNKRTPLHAASHNGHADVVELLLLFKCGKNVQDEDGLTPLHLASLNGHADVVQLLLNSKCDVNAHDKNKVAPLHFASLYGHANVVKMLLKHPCNINVPDKDSRTPLHFASQNGHAEVVKLLLDYDCLFNVQDRDGATPLHIASFFGHENVVKLLLANKCDINVLNAHGLLPLHLASLNGHGSVVKLLRRSCK